MYKIQKSMGMWHVFLATVSQFSSASRRNAIDWKALNDPISPACQLNATAGKAVWRGRV